MKEMKWKMGKVLWFDNNTGEGILIDKEGNSFYVHEGAINSKRPVKDLLKEDAKVKFTTYENSYLIQVDKVKEA